jgi:hypothetical protein
VEESAVRFVLLFLMLIASSSVLSIGISADELIKKYAKGHGIYREDELLLMQFDWNLDGHDDILLSSTNQSDDNARAGKFWDVYLTEHDGGYMAIPNETISSPINPTLQYLPQLDGRLCLAFLHSGGGNAGVMTAYWLDGAMVNKTDLEGVDFSPDASSQEKEKTKKYQLDHDAVTAKQIPLPSILSEKELLNIWSRDDDPRMLVSFRRRPESPGVSFVYDVATGGFLGSIRQEGILSIFEPAEDEAGRKGAAIVKKIYTLRHLPVEVRYANIPKSGNGDTARNVAIQIISEKKWTKKGDGGIN